MPASLVFLEMSDLRAPVERIFSENGPFAPFLSGLCGSLLQTVSFILRETQPSSISQRRVVTARCVTVKPQFAFRFLDTA